MAGDWRNSFQVRDRAVAAEDGNECSRAEMCSGRRITVEGGQRKVTPASTWQFYCQPCTTRIGEGQRENDSLTS